MWSDFSFDVMISPTLWFVHRIILNALLIGRDHAMAWTLPQLLSRAGFQVDAISSSSLMKSCKFIRNCDLISYEQPLIPIIRKKVLSEYDWIIITEDGVLSEILWSDLSRAEKLELLPVLTEQNFIHLYSKIGLSKVLHAEGILAPLFYIADSLKQAQEHADSLGYPLLLKEDSSCGGDGIFEVNDPTDFMSVPRQIFQKPILVQKKISGIELDLSALFLEGNLIHFSYSERKMSSRKFGPTSLRNFRPLKEVDREIFSELSLIGKALGAHGFTNISAILSNGSRYYIEVDMRPNVWVECPKFFGEDPAKRIVKWFLDKKPLSYPVLGSPSQPSEILIPYFLRLKRWELIFNRHHVWRFIPNEDLLLMCKLLLKLFTKTDIKNFIFSKFKKMIPEKYHNHFRKIKRTFAL